MSLFRRDLASRQPHTSLAKSVASLVQRGSSSRSITRNRTMRFDLLESRRLLAGLDVLVYADVDGSRDQNGSMELGVPRQVVYVDLNGNGSHDRHEPISITDKFGIASFTGLPASRLEVRLLGDIAGRVQTTPVRPALAETLLEDIDIDEVLDAIGSDEFLARSGNQIQRFSLDGRRIGESVSIPGNLVDSAFQGLEGWLLVDSEQSDRELYRIIDGELTKSSVDATHYTLVESIGGGFVAWDSLQGLVRLESHGESAGSVIEISKGGVLESLRPLGADRIVLEEQFENGTRLSVHLIDGDYAQLQAERTFAGDIVSWTTSTDGSAIFVDTSEGVHIVDVVNGLASRHVLASSASPLVFDPVSEILYTGDAQDPSVIRAWEPLLGSPISTIEFVTGLMPSTGVTLSGNGRFMIAPQQGGLVVRSLSDASPLEVDLSVGPVPRVSIGVQIVSPVAALPLPVRVQPINVVEDQQSEIRVGELFSGLPDSIFVVVLQQPQRGRLEWSVTTGGVYTPQENVEGMDAFTVALYDGLNWSAPQRVELVIQGQNDPPTAIQLPHRLEVSENVSGAVIGPVSVEDVDVSSAYQWSVSDHRFEVRDGVLKLRDGQSVRLYQEETITFVLRAEEVTGVGTETTNENSIETTVTVRVTANPQAGEFFVASEYSVPENQAGVALGYVYVRGGMPADQYSISASDSRFEVVNGLLKLRDSVSLRWQSDDALHITLHASASNGEQYSKPTLVRVIQNRMPFTDPHDVDGDGFITPLDVLILINHINSQGSGTSVQEGELGPRVDVDGDGIISPIDVLILINVINKQAQLDAVRTPTVPQDGSLGAAEGESVALSDGHYGFWDDWTSEEKLGRRKR